MVCLGVHRGLSALRPHGQSSLGPAAPFSISGLERNMRDMLRNSEVQKHFGEFHLLYLKREEERDSEV